MVNIKGNIKRFVEYLNGTSIDNYCDSAEQFEHSLGIVKTEKEKNTERREWEFYKITRRLVPLVLEAKGLFSMGTDGSGQIEIVLAEMIRNDEFTDIYLRDKMSQFMGWYKKQ